MAGTVPATIAPRPSGRAGGTPRRQASVIARRPVAHAITIAHQGTAAIEAAWTSTAVASATTPNGPMSGFFMISRAAAPER